MDEYVKLLDLAEKYGIKVYVGQISNKRKSTYLINNKEKIILLREQKSFAKLTDELTKVLVMLCII